MRAPVPTGSVTDLVVQLRQRGDRSTTINPRSRLLPRTGRSRRTSSTPTTPLVSTDIIHSPASCTFDSELTMATGTSAKVFGWYDNEWGYSCRLVDLISKLL